MRRQVPPWRSRYEPSLRYHALVDLVDRVDRVRRRVGDMHEVPPRRRNRGRDGPGQRTLRKKCKPYRAELVAGDASNPAPQVWGGTARVSTLQHGIETD